MKTAPDFRREPIFRGGDPISPVGFVAVPLCLGESGRVKEGEISRSRYQVGQSWLGWRLPRVVPCLPLLQQPCPIFSSADSDLAGRPKHALKNEAPGKGAQGGGSSVLDGNLGGSTPVQGMRKGFQGRDRLGSPLRMDGTVGWMETPPRLRRFRCSTLLQSLCPICLTATKVR